jgi:hypothetical protein
MPKKRRRLEEIATRLRPIDVMVFIVSPLPSEKVSC